jgi:hypothetical protein
MTEGVSTYTVRRLLVRKQFTLYVYATVCLFDVLANEVESDQQERDALEQ